MHVCLDICLGIDVEFGMLSTLGNTGETLWCGLAFWVQRRDRGMRNQKSCKFAGQRLLKSKIHRLVCFTFVAPSKVCRIEGSIVSKKPPGYSDAAMEWEAKCKVLLLKGRVIP